MSSLLFRVAGFLAVMLAALPAIPARAATGEGLSPVFSIDTLGVIPINLTLILPGGVPLVMVNCPAGTFQMGSPGAERSRESDEGPVHPVTLTHEFYIGQYEVTQQQWMAVMGNWPGEAPSSQFGLGNAYPAYFISWNDIAGSGGFIEKLNKHLAATGQAGPVRLPTEAEWEYACRAGTTMRFYFGESLTQASDSSVDGSTDSPVFPGNRSDYMWFWFNCKGNATKPVGTKLPNAWGLYDMSGNVWEWCQDWYGIYSTGAQSDPIGPGSGTDRVVRGGSWAKDAANSRAANRSHYLPTDRYSGIGFRFIFTVRIRNSANPQWIRIQ